MIAQQVNINEAYGQLLPADKINIYQQIQKQFDSTLFVGDGINDGPVLKIADCGVAMGLASDLTKDFSSVILMNNDLNSLLKTIKFTKRTRKIIWFNLIFILFIKFAVLAIILSVSFTIGNSLI